MIPHHFHFIWFGRNFPYVNRLAVESVLQTNPDAQVTIHFMDPPDNEHWAALQDRVEFLEMDEHALCEEFSDPEGLRRTLAGLAADYPAGRSNVLRYLILRKYGGIYLDFDTITLRDFSPLLNSSGFIGEEYVFRCEHERVAGKYKRNFWYLAPLFGLGWALTRLNSVFLPNYRLLNSVISFLQQFWSIRKLNNAVLACEPGSAFFTRTLERIPSSDPAIRYNLGPILMNRIWDEDGSLGITRFPPNHFYYVPPSQTIRFFTPNQTPPPKESFVVHYCSSNEKKRAAKLTPTNLHQKPNKKSILFHHLAWPVITRMPREDTD